MAFVSGKVALSKPIVAITKGILKIMLPMGMEFMLGVMAINMKGSGKIICIMDQDSLISALSDSSDNF